MLMTPSSSSGASLRTNLSQILLEFRRFTQILEFVCEFSGLFANFTFFTRIEFGLNQNLCVFAQVFCP